ncbi:MFS transporter [Novosphingobium sp. P6W]|uniref:MFS transporter n=1 Tax=Novosphingobium sp. P6W TaxID=1609758 RepID=UPI0005C2C7D4|nr:MFS transporter [Novosphingobium sp. P6W]KIS31319.1 MFS transporter [Novosphingobium sp. P6W]
MSVARGDYRFSPEEKPLFPGAPYSPRHSGKNRAIYAFSAFVMAMGSGLGNGLITSNINSIAGDMGLYVVEANLLVAVYVAFNATANLLLVKARVQFGIPATMHVVLGALVAAQIVQILAPSLGTAVLARAVSGVAAGGLTTLSLYNIFQVFPLKLRPVAAVVGFSLPQLAVPVARMFPLAMIALDNWRGLHLVELAMALAAWAMLNLMPLPPNVRERAFEPLDALTAALTIVAMLAICTALALGRYFWWTDAAFLGWAFAMALPILGLALLIEDRRARPLLWVRWYATRDILFFTLIAVVVRVSLSEQIYAAVGLLTLGGLTSDQLHPLFVVVFFAMAAGIATACLLLKPERVVVMIMAAAFIIAAGAWLDTGSTSITRPEQLYLSQALIGFGTTLFLGPALMFGIGHIIKRGPTYLVSFVVLFSTTQNVGGLAGSALLGSIQVARERLHAERLAEALSLGDPAVTARISQYASAIAPRLTDPIARAQQANGLLSQALHAQANVLAFNDTFWVVTLVALATGLFIAGVTMFEWMRNRAPETSGAPQ